MSAHCPPVARKRSDLCTLPSRSPFLVEPWLLVFVYFGCAGWLLSLVHALNALGYAIVCAIGAAVLWKARTALDFGRMRLGRFRRLLPLGFLIVAILAALGGLIHAPTNYDGISYRTPRVLQWLAEGRWFWIHTAELRQNTRTCGLEWITAPLLALTHSDRAFFLANWIAFLTLPGLIFRVFRRVGVSRQVAWVWMWIAPSGYCFALEAGSICNDALGAPFILACIDFAFAANDPKERPRAVRHLWFSLMAGAALTAVKPSNVLLLLVPAVVLLRRLPLLLERPAMTSAVAAVCILSSFLPSSIANWKQSGEWTGQQLEKASWPSMPSTTALVHIGCNLVTVMVQNIAPPVWPFDDWWQNKALPKILPRSFQPVLCPVNDTNKPASVKQLANEDEASLGAGVAFLVMLSALLGGRPGRRLTILEQLAMWTPWVAFAAFLWMAFFFASLGRILSPYYLLLLPVFLRGRNLPWLYRTPAWRLAVLAVWGVAAALIVVSPARPLWPAVTVAAHLEKKWPNSPAIKRLKNVYSVYSERAQCYDSVLAALPPGTNPLGVMAWNFPEGPLWKSYGSRRVVHVRPEDSREFINARNLSLILVSENFLGGAEVFQKWRERVHARTEQSFLLNLRASEGPMVWHLVRLLQ